MPDWKYGVFPQQLGIKNRSPSSMSSPALTRKAPEGGRTSKPRFTRPQKTIAIAIAALLTGAAVLLRTRLWPFEEGPVLQDLAEVGDSSIAIRSFHRAYFPAPGCVIDGLVFHHGQHHGDAGTRPLLTSLRLTLLGLQLLIPRQYALLVIVDSKHHFSRALVTRQLCRASTPSNMPI